MRPLNIALIGAGRRGQGAHLPVIAKMQDVYNLVAVCDADGAVAQDVARKYGARAYTSIREMAAREPLDGAVCHCFENAFAMLVAIPGFVAPFTLVKE